MRKVVLEVIKISVDACVYLRQEERKEKGCKQLSDEVIRRQYEKTINNLNYKDGLYRATRDSFGGVRNGKWVQWDIPELKERLEKAGFSWEEDKPQEAIYV